MAQAGFTNYINRKSFLHQMNPTLKFAMCVMLIVLVFIPNGIFGELILLINVMILWFGSKLPKRLFWAIIKSGFFMLAVLFVMNWVAFKTPGLVLIDKNNIIFNVDSFKSFNLGEHTYCYNIGSLAGGNIWNGVPVMPGSGDLRIFQYNGVGNLSKAVAQHWENTQGLGRFDKYLFVKIGPDPYDATKTDYFTLGYNIKWYTLSTQVAYYSIYVTLKIITMITIITILVSTTTSVELTYAIEDSLGVFKFVKAPVTEWAMVISIAIRFVPSLLADSQRIMKAQSSRGIDFKNGNITTKIKSLVSLIIPMFAVAFKKADDLGNAMDARAYDPRSSRTRYRSFSIRVSDVILMTLVGITFGFLFYFYFAHLTFGPLARTDLMI